MTPNCSSPAEPLLRRPDRAGVADPAPVQAWQAVEADDQKTGVALTPPVKVAWPWGS